jgi:hypothetical protein
MRKQFKKPIIGVADNKKESIMNPRNYRVSLNHSPLDFPFIMGLGESSVSYHSEPFLNNNKLY